MAIRTVSAVADTGGRAFAHTVNPTPKGAVRLADIRGRGAHATIPTRYGLVAATFHHPPARG